VLVLGVPAGDHAANGVEIRAAEGDAHRPVGEDRYRAQSEIDLGGEVL
jgi:hypothetical protein